MTFAPDNFVVWFEIPVTDMDKATTFYNDVFQTELMMQDMGPNMTAIFKAKEYEAGVGGHLYPGKPAAKGTGSTIHIPCPDTLEATMERVIKAGGEVVSDPIAIPAGRFVYALDIDGNSIGLFQANGA